jgi:hypothetical protein
MCRTLVLGHLNPPSSPPLMFKHLVHFQPSLITCTSRLGQDRRLEASWISAEYVPDWISDKNRGENEHRKKIVDTTTKRMRDTQKVIGESAGCAQSSRRGIALGGFHAHQETYTLQLWRCHARRETYTVQLWRVSRPLRDIHR